jgi:hypothetical protein
LTVICLKGVVTARKEMANLTTTDVNNRSKYHVFLVSIPCGVKQEKIPSV